MRGRLSMENKKGPEAIYSDIYPHELHRFIQIELGARKSPFLMDYDPSEAIWTVPVFRAEFNVMQAADNPNRLDVELYLNFPAFQFSAEEKKLNDREYIFSGRLELDYLREKYDLEFSREEAETLSGFIIQHHETIPKIKERIIIDNFEFEILSVSHTRIEMVKLKVLK